MGPYLCEFMVDYAFKGKEKATIGKAVMDSLRETIGKNVVVESFDGKKVSFTRGTLLGVSDFRSVTVKLDGWGSGEAYTIINFIEGVNHSIRTISSDDGVIYDNSENVGKRPLKGLLTMEDERLLLSNRTFGKKVTMMLEAEGLDGRLDFLDGLVSIRRNQGHE